MTWDDMPRRDEPHPLSHKDIVPGARVRLAGRLEWGAGQVQSRIGDRATVNFEEGGKQTIELSAARLLPA